MDFYSQYILILLFMLIVMLIGWDASMIAAQLEVSVQSWACTYFLRVLTSKTPLLGQALRLSIDL